MSDSITEDLALPKSVPSFYTGSDIAKATPVRPSTFNQHYQDLYDNEDYLLQVIQGVKQSIQGFKQSINTLKSKLEAMQTQINTMSEQLTDLIQNPQYNIATLEESQNIADPSNEVLMSPMRTLQLLARLGITLDENLNTIINSKRENDPILPDDYEASGVIYNPEYPHGVIPVTIHYDDGTVEESMISSKEPVTIVTEDGSSVTVPASALAGSSKLKLDNSRLE